ncbi:MAG: ABC transporter permease [Acholeplasmataceae bacterium]|jgi:oligopeptide transport system permease protein
MIRYTIRRILWAFIVLLGILTTTFIFLKLQPETIPTMVDQRRAYLHQQYYDGYMTRQIIKLSDFETKAEYDNEVLKYQNEAGAFWVFTSKSLEVLYVYRSVPIMTQYFLWVKNIVTSWNWGTSTVLKPNIAVREILAPAIGYSFKINLVILIMQIPFGLLLGITSAIKKDTVFDNIVQVIIMVFISLPSFVVMLLAIKWFGYDLKWLPQAWPPADSSTSIIVKGYIIPVVIMTTGGIAGLTRSVRAELTEGLTSEYVMLARTKGLTKRQAIYRHALRNSLLPIIPGLLFSFVGLISGSAIIEQVYSIPGVGSIMLQSLQRRDYNIIMYSTAFYGIIGLVTAVFMDLSYGFIDPRIKMGARNV